jgi:hypothetical protein
MKVMVAALLVSLIFACGVCLAADEPLGNLEQKQIRPESSSAAAAPAQQPQAFYGYVPPAPIRHTWPGGYKVIIHEMMNTLVDHVLGRY